MDENKLTPKNQLFVNEYLIDLNATQAAIRAGYSKKTAKSIGCELLTKPDVLAAIKRAMDTRAERTEITQDKVLADIEAIKQDAMRTKLDEIGEQTGMFNHQAALKACEMQGKHLGMFTDKLHVTGNISLEDLLSDAK